MCSYAPFGEEMKINRFWERKRINPKYLDEPQEKHYYAEGIAKEFIAYELYKEELLWRDAGK